MQQEEKKPIHIKAIVIGALADFGASQGALVVLVLMLTIGNSEKITSQEQLMELITGSIPRLVIVMLVGLGGTVLGGYVSGRIARHREMFHGGLVGLASVVIALPFVGSGLHLVHLTGAALAIPAGMLGGMLALKKK